MDDPAAIAELLQERPDLESPLRSVFEVDAESETWTFDDVPVDSGAFGELVSRGLMEKHEGEYRLADRAAVRSALADTSDGTGDGGGTGGTEPESGSGFSGFLAAVDARVPDRDAVAGFGREMRQRTDHRSLAALLGALFVVFLTRAYVFPSVFRNGDVVLSGNDPYYYRYWVEQLLVSSGGPFTAPSMQTVSDAIVTGEPLFVWSLWAGTTLLGGTSTAAGWVLAWYPVGAALVTAVVVYMIASRAFENRRVAIASVLFLAVTPSHAFRTSLGFADHHAFDYLWLAVTVFALVSLEARGDDDWTGREWGLSAVLGCGITAQLFAWDAGALLVVPVGVYAALRVLRDVHRDQSPLGTALPLLAGVGLAAVLTQLFHVVLEWHSGTVASIPVLLLVTVVGVVLVGDGANRYDLSVRLLAGAEVGVSVAAIAAFRTLQPALWNELIDGLRRLVQSDNIAETQSLLSGDTLGWLLLFGFTLVVAVGYLLWSTLHLVRGDGGWLVLTVYGWYFLALAVFQVRFAGQLALFTAFFTGVGFVHLASVVDITRSPVWVRSDAYSEPLSAPDRRQAGHLALLFLLVASLSLVQVPIKINQVVTDDGAYETAAWIDNYATTNNITYPDNYVLSPWGENRMYNYFVNGESQSYSYAKRTYRPFLRSERGEKWYDNFSQRGVGFIVTKADSVVDPNSLVTQLHQSLGGKHNGQSALTHYRVVFGTDDGTYRVFTLVEGATITGPGPEGESYDVSTSIEAPGINSTYTRSVFVGPAGVYFFTVPYPGKYKIENRTVTVSEEDIRSGASLNLFERTGLYFSFDTGDGDLAFDSFGGNHAHLQDSQWVDGINGSGIEFGDSGYAKAEGQNGTSRSFTVSAWVKPSTSASGAILSTGKDGSLTSHYGLLLDHGRSGGISDRFALHVGNGTAAEHVSSPELNLTYPADQYHHVAVVFDNGTVSWYFDGEHLTTKRLERPIQKVVYAEDRSTFVGREWSATGQHHNFQGRIDEVRYYDRALSNRSISQLYQRDTNAGEET